MPMNISLINPLSLRQHEEISHFKVLLLLLKIIFQRKFTKPILIDGETFTILDGHHRYTVAKLLKFTFIPALSINYLNDSRVVVYPRRKNIPVDKCLVLSKSALKSLFPIKSTKHVIKGINIHRLSIPLMDFYKLNFSL